MTVRSAIADASSNGFWTDILVQSSYKGLIELKTSENYR